jgi:UDP-glucose:(heptosyl)LPS alpha-1,3-glucosyltransferase
MKIGLLIRDFLASRGGGETFAVNLARGLADAGHSVDVYAERGEQVPGAKVHLLPAGFGPRPFKALSFPGRARVALKDKDYDIIYALSRAHQGDIYRPGAGVYSFWLKQRIPKATWRALDLLLRPMHLANLLLEQRIFGGPYFSHFITNSQLVRRQLIEEKGISPEMISVVYNGVDPHRFHPDLSEIYRDKVREDLGLSATAAVVLFLANNYERKGLRTLLLALAAARHYGRVEELRLIVAGRGRCAPFEALARRLGLEPAVRFVGFAPQPEMYYGASDLFVLPTKYDPFAGVTLEALAAGLPVITTSLNGAAEMVKEKENGFVIKDPEDECALAQKIVEYFTASDRTRMSQAASESVKEFTIERCVERTLSVFEEVLKQKREVLGGRRARLELEVEKWSDTKVNAQFSRLLKANGLGSFGEVMGFEGGGIRKTGHGRSIRVIELKKPNENPVRAYLKKERLSFFQALRPVLRLRPPRAPASREWENALLLVKKGFPVAVPVAAGARCSRTLGQESFSMTQELPGASSLVDFIPEVLSSFPEERRRKFKQKLTRRLARFARMFHGAGFHHQDFYLGHFHISLEGADDFRLWLIDLQRVRKIRRLHRHFLTKDLAQLNYSSLKFPVIYATDRMRFFKLYRGKHRLDKSDKRWIKRIWAKTRYIARHTDRMLSRASQSETR